MVPMSKSQVDRLGERLRHGQTADADLLELDEFRRSFSASYADVIGIVTHITAAAPSGRPAKSTTAIIEKLRRESIRLSQMQDIAGCRLIVPSTRDQDGLVARLRSGFQRATVVDRRMSPSHGYRAVHLIVEDGGRPVEIQIRTSLQQLWAEFSEKLSDVIDPSIKYGGGPEVVRRSLKTSSALIRDMDELEELLAPLRSARAEGTLAPGLRLTLGDAEAQFARAAQSLRESMEVTMRVVGRVAHTRDNDDLPD